MIKSNKRLTGETDSYKLKRMTKMYSQIQKGKHRTTMYDSFNKFHLFQNQ